MPVKKDLQKQESTEATTPAKKKDSRTYFYAVGKRKTSVAQVKLFPKGKGDVRVNDKKMEEYFFGVLIENILTPLKTIGMVNNYDLEIIVKGGGISSQSDAIRHGISRALSVAEEGLKTVLKRAGLLTRDSRIKERKKFGLKKARRAPQWSKR